MKRIVEIVVFSIMTALIPLSVQAAPIGLGADGIGYVSYDPLNLLVDSGLITDGCPYLYCGLSRQKLIYENTTLPSTLSDDTSTYEGAILTSDVTFGDLSFSLEASALNSLSISTQSTLFSVIDYSMSLEPILGLDQLTFDGSAEVSPLQSAKIADLGVPVAIANTFGYIKGYIAGELVLDIGIDYWPGFYEVEVDEPSSLTLIILVAAVLLMGNVIRSYLHIHGNNNLIVNV